MVMGVSMSSGSVGPVVVLGGTGWVGRNVSASFTRAGHDVLAVARNPAKRMPSARFVPMDLVTSPVDAIVELLETERPSAVVNAAGKPWGSTEPEMRVSLLGLTERVVDAVGRLSFRPRFVQVGTVMEYGPTTFGVPITEDTPPRPAAAYGRIKLASSEAVLAAGLNAVVLRLVNVAGPGTAGPSLLGRVMDCLLTARREHRPADVRLTPLRALRDYIDIRDAADAVVAAAKSDVTGQVVNIGSGTSVPVRWLVDQLIEISEVETRLTEDSAGPASPGAGGDWLEIVTTRARDRLGWTSCRPLTDALRDDWTERVTG
jgi:dTDP-6-deoxy-L-talose 4-dehydrogenase [NAD(P)+]